MGGGAEPVYVRVGAEGEEEVEIEYREKRFEQSCKCRGLVHGGRDS